MSLKIILTADVHLGMKFSNLPLVKEKLSEARFLTLVKIVDIANQKSADLLVIAGDFFDKINTAKRDIIRAASIVNKFNGKLVTILPGNHDYIVDLNNNPWKDFSEHAGDRVLILNEPKEYPLSHYDIEAVIYAGPCQSQYSEKNNIEWIKESKIDDSKYNIGVAHGSMEGVSPDSEGKYFPMRESELNNLGMDIWLLGHTDRMSFPQTPGTFSKVFYPGTPEPNGFNCNHDGSVWYFELNKDKEITAERINVGTYKFAHKEFNINNEDQLKDLIIKYQNEEYKNYLLKLNLVGRIEEELYEEVCRLDETLKENFTYFELNLEGIKRKITKELIDKEYVGNSFPNKLLMELISDQDSLELAYDILKEIQDES